MKVEYLNQPEPTLYIPEEVYNKMLANTRSTNLEITFILHIERINGIPYAFEAKDIYLPPQWNEPAESKTLDSQYPKWCVDLVKKGIKLNGHGHTHPNMSVKPSGYDVKFFKDITAETNSFQFRFILNQKGNIQCDLIDKERGYIITDMPITVNCDGFNLIVDANRHTVDIINPKKVTLASLNPDLSVTLLSKFLAVSPQEIKNTILDASKLIKPTPRNATDERILTTTRPASAKTTAKSKATADEEVDDAMRAYYEERGYYYGY